MYALQQYATGLCCAHIVWALAYLVGTLVFAPTGRENGPRAVLSIVISSVAGLSLIGMATFALGSVGMIRRTGFVLAILLVVVALILRGDSPLRAVFWRRRLHVFRRAAMSPAIIVYAVGVADFFPATLPDRMYDSIFFYNVLGWEYANAHHLVVDYFVRNPFYANNWLLIETWFWTFHIGDYVPSLTALAGLLSLLGIYGVVADEAEAGNRTGRAVAFTVAIASAAALLLNPMFLWMNSGGMLDVQLGLLFLAPCLCAYLAVKECDPRYVLPLALTAAFLVGAKLSFFALAPVFFVALWLCMRRTGFTRRVMGFTLVAFVILASPWYVMNIVGDGDPIPPYVNLALQRHDVKWSKSDQQQATENLGAARRTRLDYLSLPLDLYTNDDPQLISDGQTAICLMLFLPGFLFAFNVIARRGHPDLAVLSAITAYAIVYWLITSYHARFALLFYAALCAVTGIALLRLGRRFPRWIPAIVALSLFLATPTPSSARWFDYFWTINELTPQILPSREQFLRERLRGYVEEEYISSEFARLDRLQRRVYTIKLQELKYEFIEHGITSLGDWFGPEGYQPLIESLDRHALAPFLDSFGVDAVLMFDREPLLTSAQRAEFEREMTGAGFSRHVCPGDDGIDVYLRNDTEAPACQ